nr:MAG TPA: hypothetical protein [Caudoviricetes sp.]
MSTLESPHLPAEAKSWTYVIPPPRGEFGTYANPLGQQ